MTVAHPGQLRLIFRSKRKNDRMDAEKLANDSGNTAVTENAKSATSKTTKDTKVA